MKVLIATPAYGGQVYAEFTESLLSTCFTLAALDIQFDVKFINNQIVTRARNMLCHFFLDDPSFTHMIFIDADIVWKANDVVKLLKSDLDFVIGVYPNKKYMWVEDKLTLNPSSVFLKDEDNYTKKETRKEKYVAVKYAATGFTMFKRGVFDVVKDDVDTFFLPGNNGENIELHNYFDCNVVDKDYLTEDYYFSYLYRKNGGEIFADSTITLKHIGAHAHGELIIKRD